MKTIILLLFVSVAAFGQTASIKDAKSTIGDNPSGILGGGTGEAPKWQNPNSDSIRVKPAPVQLQNFQATEQKIALIQAELDRAKAEQKAILETILCIKLEDVETLDFKNGSFIGTKKKK